MSEIGRRLTSVLLSAFFGMGTSHLHFQKGGVDLCAQIEQRRSCTRWTVSVGQRDMRLYVTPLIPADDFLLLWCRAIRNSANVGGVSRDVWNLRTSSGCAFSVVVGSLREVQIVFKRCSGMPVELC